MRKKLIVLTTILGLIAFSGVAAAVEHEPEDTGDTTFNFGYDVDNGVFIWGSSASDGDLDCTLENGPLQAVYAEENGGLLVEDLLYLEGDDAGETFEFPSNEEGGAPVGYVEAEECHVDDGKVAGPQGQINHGMFLKLFNAMFDGQARGCMVRHIAGSPELGKGHGEDGQQVRVPDVEENNELVEENSIEFETVMTDCLHGRDQQVEGQSNGKGRPDWVTQKLENKHGGDVGALGSDDDSGRHGPPDHARGNGPKG